MMVVCRGVGVGRATSGGALMRPNTIAPATMMAATTVRAIYSPSRIFCFLVRGRPGFFSRLVSFSRRGLSGFCTRAPPRWFFLCSGFINH